MPATAGGAGGQELVRVVAVRGEELRKDQTQVNMGESNRYHMVSLRVLLYYVTKLCNKRRITVLSLVIMGLGALKTKSGGGILERG